MRSGVLAGMVLGMMAAQAAAQPATAPAMRAMRYTSRTPAETTSWQKELRQKLGELLRINDLRQAKIALDPRAVLDEDQPGYHLSEVEISSTPGRRFRALVTTPVPVNGRCPAVVCIHGHGGNRRIVYTSESIYKGFAAELARRGVVTIAADVGQHEVHEQGRTLMGERLWDLMRCVDYLETLDQVDKSRIGCAGLSLGGEMAMWLGAMDERIAATVSAGFLTVMDQMERNHCPCWKLPGLREIVDFADIYSLIAPRALQCQNGLAEPPNQFTVPIARRAMEEIKVIYGDFSRPANVELDVHDGGHVVDLPGLTTFLARHLYFGSGADRCWLIDRFDEAIGPQIESVLKEPLTNDQGGIAWGQSYQLAALAQMLEVTRDPKCAELFVKLGRHLIEARDDRHNRRDQLRDQVLPAWGSTKYSQGKHYVWAVHTGMIVEPMARFAAVVRGDTELSRRFGGQADFFLRVAEEAVAVHADQYREGPAPDEGYLFGLYLNKLLPLNQQNALARAWICIDDATGKNTHRQRVERLARFLKHRLRTTDDGAYVWAYWAPLEGPGDGFEDISHAAINVDFVVMCFEHGLVFTKEDIARLEKTLLNKVVLGQDELADTVGGTGGKNTHAGQVLRWGRLAKHSAKVRDQLLRFLRGGKLKSANLGADALGMAYLVAACDTAPSASTASPATIGDHSR